MSGREQAQRWLHEALEELSQLRNASPRDPTFRQWRQSTLTMVQRIWPGDTARARRFRRIPFTAPSATADSNQVRKWFERGWGEAGSVLRSWIEEIEAGGPIGRVVVDPADPPRPAAAPPVEARSLERPVAAPREKPKAAARPRRARGGGEPSLKEMLGLDQLESGAPPAPAATPAPRTQSPRAAAFKSRPSASRAARADRDDPREIDLSVTAPEPPRPHAHRDRQRIPAQPPRTTPAAARRDTRLPGVPETLVQLASEIESLGIPDADRDRISLALLDLAQRLELGEVPWAAVKDMVTIAMEYPALARRLLPALLPAFDRAA